MNPSRRTALLRMLNAGLRYDQAAACHAEARFATGVARQPPASAGPGPGKATATSQASSAPSGSSGNTAKPSGTPAQEGRPGSADPYTLIPLIGLPLAALYYGYQLFIQWEHEAKIADIHDSIKQSRAAMQPSQLAKAHHASPAEVKQAVVDAASAAAAKAAQIKPSVVDAAVSESAGLGSSGSQPATEVRATGKATPSTSQPASAAPPASSTQTSHAVATATTQNSSSAASPNTSAGPATAVSQQQQLGTDTQAILDAAASVAAQDSAEPAPGSTTAAAPPTGKTHATETTSTTAQRIASEDPSQHAPTVHAQSHAPPAPPSPHPSPEPHPTSSPLPPPPAPAYTPVLTSAQEPEVPPLQKGVMGVSVDLSPSGMVQFANERGHGPGTDWEAFKVHHKQAVADAELFARAVQQIQAWHEREVVALKEQSDKHEKRAEYLLDLGKRNVESFRRLLKQHQETAAEMRQIEVSQAEKRTLLSANKLMDDERALRSQVLDKLRAELGALASAHEARTAQQAASHLVHSLSLAVLELGSALDRGLPMKPHLEELLQRVSTVEQSAPSVAAEAGATDVSLVKAAAQSIPGPAAAKGIPTVEELSARLRGMKATVAALDMLPVPTEPGARTGGVLAHAVARIFASLKADESGVVSALGPDAAVSQGSVPSALAAAELYLSQGKLPDAIHVLSHAAGRSAAAGALQSWCEDAAARAKADQALTLLRAHANVLAASAL